MNKLLVFFFFALATIHFYGQELSQIYLDTLEDEELLSVFNEVDHDSLVAEKVARTYLNRGFARKDTIMIARGYDRLARVFHPKTNIGYADSIINITANSNSITYPALAYIIKAYEYERLKNLRAEHYNLLKAHEIASERMNLPQQVYVLHRLVFAQQRWGDPNKALDLQMKRHSIVMSEAYIIEIDRSSREGTKSQLVDLYSEELISSYESFISCFLTLGNYDSAFKYAEKLRVKLQGYEGLNVEYHRNYLIETQMEVAYNQGNFSYALEKANELYQNIDATFDQIQYKNLSLFKGLAQIELGKEVDGIRNLHISDSIFDIRFENLNLHYDRILFEKLFEYYSVRNQVEIKIKYLDKLLFIDSILKQNYQFFEPEHIRKFETPKLLEQKEQLIAQLERDKHRSQQRNFWIGGILLGSMLVLGYYFNRQLVYKKRF